MINDVLSSMVIQMRAENKADSRGHCGHTLQLKDLTWSGGLEYSEGKEEKEKKEKHE